MITVCGELTLTGHQVPTKASLSFTSATGQKKRKLEKRRTGQKRKNYNKTPMGEITHSPVTVTGSTDLTYGNYLNLLLIKIRVE